MRTNYVKAMNIKDDWAQKGYFRFVDHATGKPTKAFAAGYLFGSTFVEGDTVYVTGTSSEQQWTGQRVQIWASRDLQNFESYTALDLHGFLICNTSICKADDKYVMMFEIHVPRSQAGKRFTARFATSKDLRHWQLTPPECVYTKDHFSAPHCLRYLDGWFYNFYVPVVTRNRESTYDTHVVRSRDLQHWQPSPFNPVLHYGPADKQIANPDLTADQRQKIADATNINNSDIDFCEFKGQLIINYSWGNQAGLEFLAEARYRGTLEQFLSGWFPQ